jgi:hypothetical protein
MRPERTTKVLGVGLTPPSIPGLLRLLLFLVGMVMVVEVADVLTQTAWSSDGSLALIVGGFSGFLLSECGASFEKHGWRAFALLIICSGAVFATAGLVV